MFDFIKITKALSDKNRVRIIMALRQSPLCVCQLTSLLGLAPSTTSKHINILQNAKIVESMRNGKWVFYKLCSEKKNPLMVEVLNLVEKGSVKSSEIVKDKKNLKNIMEEYCDVHGEFHNNLLTK